MALTDRFKDIKSKAEDAVLERKDQIQQAVQKAGEVADQRTGGKYHDKIEKVGGKALGYVESLDDSAKDDPGSTPTPPTEAQPVHPDAAA
ncbi:MAG: antitoxin [Solirubrobacteraceae bacterium]